MQQLMLITDEYAKYVLDLETIKFYLLGNAD